VQTGRQSGGQNKGGAVQSWVHAGQQSVDLLRNLRLGDGAGMGPRIACRRRGGADLTAAGEPVNSKGRVIGQSGRCSAIQCRNY
jgi:hypothetical protein